MSLIVFQHVANEDAAILGQILARDGHRLRVVRLFAGDPTPPDLDDVDGVISMGGPMNAGEVGAYPWLAEEMSYLKAAHEAKLPIVGVCLGAQLIAQALGGKVEAMPQAEVGWHNVRLAFPGTIDPIMAGIPWNTMQFHLHGQQVTELPPEATPLAGSARCKVQAFKVGLTTYAFQYHFEWDRRAIDEFSRDPFVQRAGADPEAIVKESDQYFEMYRHLGNRLCQNLCSFLLPIDKRRTA